jgi:hypothetical protein
MRRTGGKSRDETGFISIQYVMAAGFSLLFLVMMMNLVAIQYGRSVVRASADEASRAGARVVTDPVKSCDDRAHAVAAQVERLASSVEVRCQIVGSQMQATAVAHFPSWLPGMPTFTEEATAVSRREVAPT